MDLCQGLCGLALFSPAVLQKGNHLLGSGSAAGVSTLAKPKSLMLEGPILKSTQVTPTCS